MDLLARTTDILDDLIAFPTVSSESNLDMIAYMAALLERDGARVERMPSSCGTKANLFATLGPDGNGGIVLSGHTDVVPITDQDWSSDPFKLDRRNGRFYGRGTCDMKGFLAATLAMVPQFATRIGRRPLHFAFTYDEEVGCHGAEQLTKTLKTRGLTPAMAIIGEPTEMQIIEGHKGCNEYTTRFHGTSGHGSRPDLGVNTAEYATRYAQRLLQLGEELRHRSPADSPFTPPWTTINIGKFSAGVARNVIAPMAEIEWEMRPVQPGDAAYVHEALQRLCEEDLLPAMRAVHSEASIELDVIGEVAGLMPTEDNKARQLVSELTGETDAALVAFGTEAGLFQELGCDAVLCGPGAIAQAHQPDEYLSIDQLQQCLTMLQRLAERLDD